MKCRNNGGRRVRCQDSPLGHQRVVRRLDMQDIESFLLDQIPDLPTAGRPGQVYAVAIEFDHDIPRQAMDIRKLTMVRLADQIMDVMAAAPQPLTDRHDILLDAVFQIQRAVQQQAYLKP
jgi:hypothetical protein